MHEDVAESAEPGQRGTQLCRDDALGGETAQDLLVALRGSLEGADQNVIPDVQHNLAAELQSALDEPLQILSARIASGPRSR